MDYTREISPGIHWVGGNDRRLALFENMFPLPQGVAYNSCLLYTSNIIRRLLDPFHLRVGFIFFRGSNIAYLFTLAVFIGNPGLCVRTVAHIMNVLVIVHIPGGTDYELDREHTDKITVIFDLYRHHISTQTDIFTFNADIARKSVDRQCARPADRLRVVVVPVDVYKRQTLMRPVLTISTKPPGTAGSTRENFWMVWRPICRKRQSAERAVLRQCWNRAETCLLYTSGLPAGTGNGTATCRQTEQFPETGRLPTVLY